MNDFSLYEKVGLGTSSFPMLVHQPVHTEGFISHWHEQMELLYCIEGSGTIECDSVPFEMHPGDLIIINSNQLHCGHCTGEYMSYYCFIIDPSFLKGSFVGCCEEKYITPIIQNLTLFENRISGKPVVAECIELIANEFRHKELGYELAIKSSLYKLLVILLRNHVRKVITHKEYTVRLRNLEKLHKVLEFIEQNYTENITICQLAEIAYLSRDYFNHLFKKLTGSGANEYVNSYRINKAELLLKNTDMDITEIAMNTGFNNASYFSRMFRKYKKSSPSFWRNSIQFQAYSPPQPPSP